MSKRKKHKPRIDWICTPTFVAEVLRSIKANRGRLCQSLPGSVGSTCRRPWMDFVASGTRTHSKRTRRPPTRPNLCSPG
ncbi:Hypothetical protein FKW44_014763 [Caligus rogercresseyi]|uniref:Uncharacterized protein n=1 Tax=Caligus rogercresseyi TaxID=217165 RepID=A0A7T8K0N7_CALRO|nr:Hypothetical protein FKW44_014763 [Caligus rogercresseyi]